MCSTSSVTAARADTPRPTRFGRVIAHRGASGHAPENTLAAFRLAVAQGATALEFDVSLLGDGTAVVCHDGTLDRCTNRSGPLSTIDKKDLAEVDAGAWFSPEFAGERLPTLEEVLDLIDALDLSANLEMKAHGAMPGPLAAAVASALNRRAWAGQRITISSFDHGELVALRQLAPESPLAVLYEAPTPDWRNFLASLNAEAIHLDQAELDVSLIHAAREDGRAVRIYTVNDPASAAGFRDAGLDGLFTDYPSRFLSIHEWAEWDRSIA